ncbi:hypothetical protein Y032_0283g1333 [Ancylostoma ceylanicum]|uniref:Uncharacterized protein n=1 Tax=Ancylostoma ceylanicum TaxID=53326 RepID=A0A016S6Z5_9BILA|nr:hypothetical protein Y032_0283g1333 [Ancylostoma ceylanicum]
MFLLLVSLLPLVTADVKTVTLVQSINLKTAEKSDITCSSIKQVFIESAPVTSKSCMGETTEKEQGMWIIIQMDPVSLKDHKVEWTIEYTGGNLTSSFNVTDSVEKPLSTTSVVEIAAKAKARAIDTNRVNIRRKREDTPPTAAPTGGSTTAPEPSKASEPTKAPEPTKKPEPAASTSTQAPAPPTASKINVTVNYIQFHTGQAPVYVNKHTQAVVVAVIEGLILGAILALVIFRCYRRSKLRAAGLYPSSSDYPVGTYYMFM